jgi:hypothetical protein
MKITTDKYQRENLIGLVLTVMVFTSFFLLSYIFENQPKRIELQEFESSPIQIIEL